MYSETLNRVIMIQSWKILKTVTMRMMALSKIVIDKIMFYITVVEPVGYSTKMEYQ